MSMSTLLAILVSALASATAAVYFTRRRPPVGLPKIDIGVPVAYELTRGPQTVRREFVAVNITSSPAGTFVELQDRESYEHRNRLR